MAESFARPRGHVVDAHHKHRDYSEHEAVEDRVNQVDPAQERAEEFAVSEAARETCEQGYEHLEEAGEPLEEGHDDDQLKDLQKCRHNHCEVDVEVGKKLLCVPVNEHSCLIYS